MRLLVERCLQLGDQSLLVGLDGRRGGHVELQMMLCS